MKIISRHSLSALVAWGTGLWSLVFADDVILLATLGYWTGSHLRWESGSLNPRPRSLARKRLGCPLWVGDEIPWVGEFGHIEILLVGARTVEWEINRDEGLHGSLVVTKELSWKGTLLISQSIYISTLMYGHKLWVVTEWGCWKWMFLHRALEEGWEAQGEEGVACGRDCLLYASPVGGLQAPGWPRTCWRD